MLLVPPDLSAALESLYLYTGEVAGIFVLTSISPLLGQSSRHCKMPQWEGADVCSKPFSVTPGSLQLASQTFVGFSYCSTKQHKARCDYPQLSMLLLVL